MIFTSSMESDARGAGVGEVLRAQISIRFRDPVGRVLDGFEIRCREGEILAVVGASGCGKSTILNMVAGMVPPDVEEAESAITFRGGDPIPMGFAFQNPFLLPWRTVEGNAYHEAEVLGIDDGEAASRVEALLEATRLTAYRKLYPQELSAGMRQRLQLVRVLACPRPLMLLDEPLGAVDQPTRIRIAETARTLLKASRSACLWVTHDSVEAVAVADAVLVVSGRPLKITLRHNVSRPSPGQQGTTTLSHVNQPPSPNGNQAACLLKYIMRLPEAMADHTDRDTSSLKKEGRPQIVMNISSFLPLLPVGVVLSAWEAIVGFNPGLEFYLSAPSQWLPALGYGITRGPLLVHLTVTLSEAGLGLLIALFFGSLLGFLTAASRELTAAFRPLFVGMSAVPLFVLAPAFILWFGVGFEMKVAVAAMSAFPFIAYMTLDGAVSAKGDYYMNLKHSARRWKLFSSLIIPSTLEGVIAGMRPAGVAALIGAFLGEFIAADRGIGYFIVLQASRYNVTDVIAGVTLLFVVGIGIDSVLRRLASARHRLISLVS